jgi:hypothetical protein
MNTAKFTFVFSIGVLVIALLTAGVVIRHRFSSKPMPTKRVNIERDFTPEQKAVLSAIRQAQADLEKSKVELIQLITEAKVTAITKNIDPNVRTIYIAHGVNGSWGIRTGTTVPVLLGFRDDRLVTWKYADE